MNNQHSIIPPSSAGIWGKPDGCTGWAAMAQLHPEGEPSQDSKDGTATHEIAASIIDGARVGHVRDLKWFLDKPATNGVIFTEEMYDSAKIYADNFIAVMRERAIFDGNAAIEQPVAAPAVHYKSFGTPDAFIYDNQASTLFVWDFKYGFVIHEVYENWQVINYVAGLINYLNLNGLENCGEIIVHMRIVQPRAFHRDGSIREWTVKLSDLWHYIETLNRNAHISLDPVLAKLRSGDHCKYCQSRHDCPAALSAGLSMYETAMKPSPLDMSLEAMGVQLSIIKRAKQQIELLETGYTESIQSLIRGGSNIPGWTVEQGYGREKWNRPTKEILELGKLLGVDFSKPDKAITPNQAMSLYPDKDLIKIYTETPRTGLKLVPDNLTKAKQVFGS